MSNLSPKQPHVIIFNPDSWRWDVTGHLGNPAAVTPRLDEIVQTDAVSFNNAYCQNPVCVPSRCSFMTGWYTHVRGHRSMVHGLYPDEPMLLRSLKKAGYHVWWGGRNHIVHRRFGLENYCTEHYKPGDGSEKKPRPNWGLDEVNQWRGEPGSDTYYGFLAGELDCGDDPYYMDNDWHVILAAIDKIKHAPKDQPLCLYLPLTYPHPPYSVEEPWFSMIDRSKIPARVQPPKDWSKKPSMLKGIYDNNLMKEWPEERWTDLRSIYYGMCARVDHQFGMLMDALKETGMYDDTAVFFFADHGDFTGDYGLVEKTQNTFEDCLSRVPLIVKPPAWKPVHARVSDAMVELIDVPATIEEYAGIIPEHTHFGMTLSELLAGETDRHREAVFCEGGRLKNEPHCIDQTRGHTTSDSLYWPRLKTQGSDGPEHTKALMCRTKDFKYVQRLYELDELYDMNNDPHELNNLIDDPNYKDVLLQMKDIAMYHLLATSDVVPHDTRQDL